MIEILSDWQGMMALLYIANRLNASNSRSDREVKEVCKLAKKGKILLKRKRNWD
jgi:hypothetical protein